MTTTQDAVKLAKATQNACDLLESILEAADIPIGNFTIEVQSDGGGDPLKIKPIEVITKIRRLADKVLENE